MARIQTFKFCVLNVKTQPHSPEKYIELFKRAANLKGKVKIRGDQVGIIGMLKTGTGVVEGQAFKFTLIDNNASWYNISKNEEASEEEVLNIQIPKDLAPNLRKFNFVLFPSIHMVAVETYTVEGVFGATSIRTFFHNLLNQPELEPDFGEVDVILQPEKEAIERAFNLSRLESLNIAISKPNMGDFFDDKSFYDKLDKMKVREFRQELRADGSNSIEPDEEIQGLARLGAKDGVVRWKGVDLDGEKVDESTSDHPMIRKGRVTNDFNTRDEAFLDSSQAIMVELFNWTG